MILVYFFPLVFQIPVPLIGFIRQTKFFKKLGMVIVAES
jgi:hypothetical protein